MGNCRNIDPVSLQDGVYRGVWTAASCIAKRGKGEGPYKFAVTRTIRGTIECRIVVHKGGADIYGVRCFSNGAVDLPDGNYQGTWVRATCTVKVGEVATSFVVQSAIPDEMQCIVDVYGGQASLFDMPKLPI